MKLGEEEYNRLLEAKKQIKQHGISTFSESAQKTIKNGALGCCIHLGSQLIIEHLQKRFPETEEVKHK